MTNKNFLVAAAISLGTATGVGGVRHSNAAEARVEEVVVDDITTPLVPNDLLEGDREFDGHGPIVDCGVEVRVSADQRSLSAHVTFQATETEPDHSTVRGEWDRVIYTAPAGERIVAFEGPSSGSGLSRSDVSFLSEPAGFQILAPGEDFRDFALLLADIVKRLVETFGGGAGLGSADVERAEQIAEAVRRGVGALDFEGNRVELKEPSNGGPVALFAIVGDTGGDDISDDDDPKDDTRIQAIAFRPLRVTLAPL